MAFTLRNVPQPIWDAAIARADREGWSITALLIQLLDDYGQGRLTLSGPPPTTRS